MNISFYCDFEYELKYEHLRIIHGDFRRDISMKNFVLVIWGSLVIGAIPWALGYEFAGVFLFLGIVTLYSSAVLKKKKALKVIKDGDENDKNVRATITEENIRLVSNGTEQCLLWEDFDSYYDGTLGCHLFLDQQNGFIIPFSEIDKHMLNRDFMEFVKSKVAKPYQRNTGKR